MHLMYQRTQTFKADTDQEKKLSASFSVALASFLEDDYPEMTSSTIIQM